jgi:membrane-bound metal-dependent hydrolase YbcI (DUF457 family)
MTTFEHAMLGVTGAAAARLHERYGWRIAAVAALAAISPDWDGIFILGSIELFDRAHRVWGHNLLVASLVGAMIGELDYRLNVTGRVGQWLGRYVKTPAVKEGASAGGAGSTPVPRRLAWIVVGVLAALSHLPADLLVSGTDTLADWEVKLAWPFSDRGWVFPRVHWGDPGISVIFAAGMVAMAVWPKYVRATAAVSLVLVGTYLLVRPLAG